jgi:hypothetical protein
MPREAIMAINVQKVVLGGVVAGIVAFVLDFSLNGLFLSGAWEQALTSLNPDLAEGMDSPAIIAGVAVADILWGVALVLLYAAIRPRFGAGAGTALRAALLGWLLVGITWSTLSIMGMFSWTLFALSAVCWLVVSVGAAEVGALLYKEGEPVPQPGSGTPAMS